MEYYREVELPTRWFKWSRNIQVDGKEFRWVMYNMTGEEMVLVAKIIAHAFGHNSEPLTDHDKEIAFEMMKHMTDQRVDMTRQQKEEFTVVPDPCQNQSLICSN